MSSRLRLEGQVAVITGAASGIGEATARLFVSEGARCLIADIQDDRGDRLASELGPSASFVHADVGVEEDVAGAVDAALARFGRLDCIFNNAGILGAVGPIASIDGAAWRRTIDVLLHSVFYGVKHAARVMIPQASGTIITTASTAGVRAGLGPHTYTAAKHGAVGLCQSAASELGRHGIRVNVIAPGATVTALTANLSTGDPDAYAQTEQLIARDAPLGRPGRARDIANAALFLASEESSYVNGAVLVVDAGGEVNGSKTQRFYEMAPEIVQEHGRKGV
jgi:NAD(P)-dependent dehydrogenase (short-subunit alcohol dehydrogenase family)